MKNAKNVENFIRSIFEVYGLNYGEYFSAFTADDEKVELPMVIDGALDMAMVSRAAEILGEDVEDLLTLNRKKAAKWQIKFPYIEYKQAFEDICNRAYYRNDYDTIRLMEVIWDVECPRKAMRFDDKAVTERLRSLLKEYNKFAPGTFHDGATIKQLRIHTATFCHFAELEQMMASFFEMIERTRGLFFKALGQDLDAEEIKEYNILVSVLGIRDRYIPKKGSLHYSMLRKLAPIYKAEKRTDFFDYVMLDPAKDIAPWRCSEFVLNRDMVQDYVNVFPGAKKAMREYALLVTQFHCSFAWSDAAPLSYTSADDNPIYEIGKMMQHMRLCEDYGGLEPTSIYVPKTVEEIGTDGVYADILNQLAGSVAKGGVTAPGGLLEKPLDIPKFMSRISTLGGNSYE